MAFWLRLRGLSPGFCKTPSMSELPRMSWLTAPARVELQMLDQLVRCWREVANAGGAVGFPFLPVTDEQVQSSAKAMIRSLGQGLNRILVATVGDKLAGWLLLTGNPTELTAHWARISRVQTALEFRGRGVGRSLMVEAARAARDDLELEQLCLELRAGLGLERFYQSCGWHEVGRWPGALRLPEGDADEVLMCLTLNGDSGRFN